MCHCFTHRTQLSLYQSLYCMLLIIVSLAGAGAVFPPTPLRGRVMDAFKPEVSLAFITTLPSEIDHGFVHF